MRGRKKDALSLKKKTGTRQPQLTGQSTSSVRNVSEKETGRELAGVSDELEQIMYQLLRRRPPPTACQQKVFNDSKSSVQRGSSTTSDSGATATRQGSPGQMPLSPSMRYRHVRSNYHHHQHSRYKNHQHQIPSSRLSKSPTSFSEQHTSTSQPSPELNRQQAHLSQQQVEKVRPTLGTSSDHNKPSLRSREGLHHDHQYFFFRNWQKSDSHFPRRHLRQSEGYVPSALESTSTVSLPPQKNLHSDMLRTHTRASKGDRNGVQSASFGHRKTSQRISFDENHQDLQQHLCSMRRIQFKMLENPDIQQHEYSSQNAAQSTLQSQTISSHINDSEHCQLPIRQIPTSNVHGQNTQPPRRQTVIHFAPSRKQPDHGVNKHQHRIQPVRRASFAAMPERRKSFNVNDFDKQCGQESITCISQNENFKIPKDAVSDDDDEEEEDDDDENDDDGEEEEGKEHEKNVSHSSENKHINPHSAAVNIRKQADKFELYMQASDKGSPPALTLMNSHRSKNVNTLRLSSTNFKGLKESSNCNQAEAAVNFTRQNGSICSPLSRGTIDIPSKSQPVFETFTCSVSTHSASNPLKPLAAQSYLEKRSHISFIGNVHKYDLCWSTVYITIVLLQMLARLLVRAKLIIASFVCIVLVLQQVHRVQEISYSMRVLNQVCVFVSSIITHLLPLD